MSNKDFIFWGLGVVLATALMLIGTGYLINNILARPDSFDLLTKESELKPAQENRLGGR